MHPSVDAMKVVCGNLPSSVWDNSSTTCLISTSTPQATSLIKAVTLQQLLHLWKQSDHWATFVPAIAANSPRTLGNSGYKVFRATARRFWVVSDLAE
jgi:hypothetical protein